MNDSPVMRRINRLIPPERRHYLSHGDGTHCIHDSYPCDEIMIPPWPVLDTKYDPPVMRDDICMACLCECPPCTTLRDARHVIMGVDGYGPGVVWKHLALGKPG